jgi:hypothetical protein
MRRNRALRTGPNAGWARVDSKIQVLVDLAHAEGRGMADAARIAIEDRAAEMAGVYCPDCGRLSGYWDSFTDEANCCWCGEVGTGEEWAARHKSTGVKSEQATH